MADETPTPETTGTEAAAKPRRKALAPPAVPAPQEPEQTAAAAPARDAAPTPEWIRYTGQTPVVFMDLGGEIEPGQTVKPSSARLAGLLLARGDFEAAVAPAHDDGATGTDAL